MKQTTLLSPELKAKVTAKVKECYQIAEKKYQRPFPLPEIRFDIKSWVGGLAYPGQNIVRFNLILLVENEAHYIEHVVPHEIAHLINHIVSPIPEGKKRLMPHGKEWKQVMSIFKIPAKVKHKYDCSSIEKNKKPKRRGRHGDRVARILKQIYRLTQEERLRLKLDMKEME